MQTLENSSLTLMELHKLNSNVGTKQSGKKPASFVVSGQNSDV